MVIYNSNYKKNNFFNLYLSISYYVYIVLKNVLFTFILLLSLFLLIYSKKNNGIANCVRESTLFVTYPYIAITNVFNDLSDSITNNINNFLNIEKINKQLIEQNLKLKLQLFNLKILKEENYKLKEMLNVVSTENKQNYSIEKINIITNTSFTSKIEIKSNEKMKNNDLVIDKDGNLVGKIINVNDEKATILLITDHSFRIPAILEKSMTKVIVGGTFTDFLDINYFSGEKFNILDNEMIFTSNDGDIAQAGIPIGTVFKKNDKIKVKIFSNLNKLDYVIILHKKENISENLINNDIENKKIFINKDNEKQIINNKYNTQIKESIKKELNDI